MNEIYIFLSTIQGIFMRLKQSSQTNINTITFFNNSIRQLESNFITITGHTGVLNIQQLKVNNNDIGGSGPIFLNINQASKAIITLSQSIIFDMNSI